MKANGPGQSALLLLDVILILNKPLVKKLMAGYGPQYLRKLNKLFF